MDLGKLGKLQHHRECLTCGAEFETDEKASALERFSDHQVEHNPTPEQWGIAHERIQAAKDKRPSRY